MPSPIMFASVSVSVLAAAAAAMQQPVPATPASSTAPIAACFAEQSAVLPISGVVLAARGDDVFVTTAGFSDAARAVPISRETRFRLASVSKTITATAIGLLVDQGRLSLDDPIGAHIAELPPELAAITVEQLLHHRSGLGLGTMMRPDNYEVASRARTASDLLPIVIRERPAFPPGERVQYSNSGYVLLGVIIERLTGRSYSEHLQATIFGPLGMTSTGLVADERMAMPMTRMSGPGGPPLAGPVVEQMSLRSRGSPAGNAISTVDDLLRLGRFLLGDRMLTPATKARIFPPRGGVQVIGQAGGTAGVNADFSVLPESGWVLVVLTNADPPAGEIMGAVLRAAALGRGCDTMTAAERPSPMMRRPPPAGAASPTGGTT